MTSVDSAASNMIEIMYSKQWGEGIGSLAYVVGSYWAFSCLDPTWHCNGLDTWIMMAVVTSYVADMTVLMRVENVEL